MKEESVEWVMFGVLAFAAVVVIALISSRRLVARIRGLWGTGLEITKEEVPPGIRVDNATAVSGSVNAHAEDGGGISAGRLVAGQDVVLRTGKPSKNDPDPKG